MMSLTSQKPRQKKHFLTNCAKHTNFYLVREYEKYEDSDWSGTKAERTFYSQ